MQSNFLKGKGSCSSAVRREVIHVLHCKLLKQSDLMLADTLVQQF